MTNIALRLRYPNRPRAFKCDTHSARKWRSNLRLLRRNEDEAGPSPLEIHTHTPLLVDMFQAPWCILQFVPVCMHISAYYFECQPPRTSLPGE
jgi:hypothetical protein